MRLFSGQSTHLKDRFCLHIPNERAFYTSGDHIRGSVFVAKKYWQSMLVEVLLICEEFAEHNPLAVSTPLTRYRRSTYAGETLDGELKVDEDDGELYGSFDFDLAIRDGMQPPYLLPSFEVDSGKLRLRNAIKWVVEARVYYKHRSAHQKQEIVLLPSKPMPVSSLLQHVPNQVSMPVYLPKLHRIVRKLELKSQQSVTVSGSFRFPQSGLQQYPVRLPLQLVLTFEPPSDLVSVAKITVELITIASAEINGQVSLFEVPETLFSAEELALTPENGELDLTQLISDISIENTCPDFAGKWLKMQHQLKVRVWLHAVHKPDCFRVLTFCSMARVKTPALNASMIDAPPQYSPSSESPASLSTILPYNAEPGYWGGIAAESGVLETVNSEIAPLNSHALEYSWAVERSQC